MNLLAIYVKKPSLLKTAMPELCRFCFIQSQNAQTYMQQVRTTGNVVAP